MRCESAMNRTLAGITNTFDSVLKVRPEIRINQTVVYEQTASIAEFAIVSKEQLVDYTYQEHKQIIGGQIPLTEKKITARALYTIKAGFDLHQPFVVDINSESGKIEAELPPAQILSLEQLNAPTLKDEAGLLNPVTEEERQQVLDGLAASARQAAVNSGLVQDAEKQALERLQEISKRNGQSIQFHWQKLAFP
jgi:Protein of unknown function (DUF4230)